VLCAPFTALSALSKACTVPGLRLVPRIFTGNQPGPIPGEISGDMLRELGVRYAIVGHSERRQYFGETDETVNLRLQAAQIVG
jgi:triosephosphate isomerase